MSTWRMGTKDFLHLLEVEQDYRCPLTGYELTPDNFAIVDKVKGIRSLANTALVHQDVEKLVKDHGFKKAVEVCRAVATAADRGHK